MSVRTETETPGRYRQVLTVDGFTLHADLTADEGGDGSAPDAHGLFDASLAACKALTATWYAKRKGMALDRVEASVERDTSREREGTYVLKVRLAFIGALSDDDRQKLEAAVAKCPVHKLMTTTTVEIVTEMVAAG